MPAGGNYTWKLRGGPGAYTQDRVDLTGAPAPTLTIDPAATLTLDLTGVDHNVLASDVGVGNFRDYTILTAAANTAHFTPGQIAPANAPGFSTNEFMTYVNNGAVTLRFTPVPEPACVLAACAAGTVAAGLVRRYRRRASN